MKRTTHNRPNLHRVLNATSAKLAAVLLPLAAMTLGCAKKQDPRQLVVFPAEGKVTFNGKVPEGAYIALHPKDANLAKDSKFIAPRKCETRRHVLAFELCGRRWCSHRHLHGHAGMAQDDQRPQRRSRSGAKLAPEKIQQSGDVAGGHQHCGRKERIATHCFEIGAERLLEVAIVASHSFQFLKRILRRHDHGYEFASTEGLYTR